MLISYRRYVRTAGVAAIALLAAFSATAFASPSAPSAEGTVIAGDVVSIELGFSATGTPSAATGYVQYFNGYGEVFAGNVTCYNESGGNAVMAGPITYSNFPAPDNKYFRVNAHTTADGHGAIDVVVADTPYNCASLLTSYAASVDIGRITLSP